MIILEHNLEVTRRVGWVADLGPEDGASGGRCTASDMMVTEQHRGLTPRIYVTFMVPPKQSCFTVAAVTKGIRIKACQESNTIYIVIVLSR